MSNGEVCCLLGICCPPDATRKGKVAPTLAKETGLTIAQANAVFDWFDSRVDFVPKGTGQPLIDSVVTMAKGTKA